MTIGTAAFGFGQNKVQYTQFSWQYHDLPHFHSYFHQNQAALPTTTAVWAEQAHGLLRADFGTQIKKQIPLLVFGSPLLFEQTNVINELIPEGVGGFTEQFKSRIVIPFTGSYADYRHVLHHELVHAFQFAMLFDNFGSSLIRSTAVQMPLWFAEGSAEYLSSGWDNEADMFMMDQVINGNVPPPGPALGGYMAYKGGQSFFHFLEASAGDSAFKAFLHAFSVTKNPELAIKRVYGRELKELGRQWLAELKRIYWPEIGRREQPEDKAVGITTASESRSFFNLKPRISPDGTKIAFFSDLKDFTQIFVTDRSGKILHNVRQYGYGGFFEAFQPFRSGLCWGPDNEQLAFVTKNQGANEIRIVNVKTKKLVRTIRPGLLSISAPDWSADGRLLVFCGLQQDRSDLYLYDLQNGSLRRLTDDPAFESEPRFSRDGGQIIYAAQDTVGLGIRDRHSPAPPFNLFSYRLADSSATRLTNDPWNQRQPSFAPDGKHLAFVADRNGINNIYIAALDSLDSARALTDFVGACSDPDWARDTNALVFTLFQKQKWDIWLIDKPDSKTHATQPSLTLWQQSLQDTAVAYYKKRPIVKDTTILRFEESEITEIRASADAPPAANRRSAADTPGISEEPDTAGADRASLAAADTADASAPDSTSSMPTAADTGRESIAAVADSGQTESPDSTQAPFNPGLLRAKPYRLTFSPDIASVGMNVNPYYGYSGGAVVQLSDLLGNHRIALAGSLQGSLDEFQIFSFYQNSTHRLDFGIGGYCNRYFTYLSTLFQDQDQNRYYVDSLFRDTDVGFMISISYPFSMFSRLDFNLNYRNLKREHYRFTGRGPSRVPSLASYSYNITMPSLSYVFDNILWGITGPVNGVRGQASLIVAPPLSKNDAAFTAFDADVRKYFHFAKRFVWANKLTFGASLPMNGSSAQRRYYLGGNENWFNYSFNDSTYYSGIKNLFYSDLIVPFRGWRYFDISGSRYAVLNTEFRFPFIREISIVWPLPIEIRYINGAAFIDVGNAWDRGDQRGWLPLPSTIYGGFGWGMRANLGIFVLRWDLAWPTDFAGRTGRPVNYFSLGADF